MSAELRQERGERAFLSLRSFINAQYDKALAAWSAGERSGRFPVGTCGCAYATLMVLNDGP